MTYVFFNRHFWFGLENAQSGGIGMKPGGKNKHKS